MKSKIMKRQNVRTLSLIVCTFTYLFVGAAVFDALESREEINRYIETVWRVKGVTIVARFLFFYLFVGSAVFDPLESREEVIRKNRLLDQEMSIRNKYNMSEADFLTLERNVKRTVSYYAGIQWKFTGAFYFALTVITAIGYGHSTPQTVYGKCFCMFYALVGIPLCIVMFQSVGERLNVFITYSLKQLRKCMKFANQEVSQTHVIFVTTLLSTLVFTLGALMFAHYEKWKYLESFYYCFITLTTIGFGDYVALQERGTLQNAPEYVTLSIIFILFGLTVISAAMNLLVLRFLTMNTMDERRDELEAAVAAQNAIHLEGDVITSNGNVHVVSNAQERAPANQFSETISVCSCSCYKWRSNKKQQTSSVQERRRSQIISTGGKVNHGHTQGRDDSSDETDSFLQYHSKRNSL